MPEYSAEENEEHTAMKERPGFRSHTAIITAIVLAGLVGIVSFGLATLGKDRMNSGASRKTEDKRLIYHLVVDGDFQRAIENGAYRPDSLSADGFVHCALKDSVIPVANEYFSRVSKAVLVLAIDPDLLSSETRYEEAKPIAGGGADQLTKQEVFPHVYGPIDCDAVTGVGRLGPDGDGFRWPPHFRPVSDFLSVSESQ